MGQRSAVATILPGKLYQRGQFLTWPAKQKQALLQRHGITVVVNMWCKIDPDLSPEELNRIYLNWHCSPSKVPPNADLFVKFLAALIKQGHVLLIHCEAGRGRSIWLTTRVLAEYMDIDRSAALDAVERCITSHSLTPTLRADLEE